MIDVILPTTGRPSLKAAIESVLAQTHEDFELYIVCDGCYPDLSYALDDRCTRITIDGPNRDSGTTARRAGIAAGSNPWVAYLDDDDIYLPHHIESLLKFATEGGYDAVHSHGQQFKFSRGKKKVSGVVVPDPTTVSMLHKRSLYERSEGWQNVYNHDHRLFNFFVKNMHTRHGTLPQVTYYFYRGKR